MSGSSPHRERAEAREAYRQALDRGVRHLLHRFTERDLAQLLQSRRPESLKVPVTVTSLRRHAELAPGMRPLSLDAVRFLAEFFAEGDAEAVISARQRLEELEGRQASPARRSGRRTQIDAVNAELHDQLLRRGRLAVRWAGVTQRYAWGTVCDLLAGLPRDHAANEAVTVELSMLAPEAVHTLDEVSSEMRQELHTRRDEAPRVA